MARAIGIGVETDDLTTVIDPLSDGKAAVRARRLEAIEIARRQRAKSFELRAATSLSRLRADQGKRAEARALLSDIYGSFTEGFDTADLREAKLLLEELETRAGASRAGQTTRSLPAAATEGP